MLLARMLPPLIGTIVMIVDFEAVKHKIEKRLKEDGAREPKAATVAESVQHPGLAAGLVSMTST